MAKSTATSDPAPREFTVSSRALAIHLVLAGLLLTSLLVYDLGGRELWTDEEFSLAAGGPNLQHAMFGDASHPPGYPLLLHYWLRARTGPEGQVTDGWLRAFSIPWALITWLLGYAIAARLGLRREGLLAAWLMAFSPLVIMYFRLGRYYSMTAALTMLALYLALLALRHPVWWRALLLALSVAALGYTDFLGLQIALAALFLFTLSALVRRDYRPLATLAAGSAFAFLLLIPLFLMAVTKAAAVAAIQADPLATSLWGFAVKLALPVFSLATGEAIDPWRFALTIPAVLITTALLLLGLFTLVVGGVSRPRPPGTACDGTTVGGTTGPEGLRHDRALIALLWPLTILLATITMSTVGANVPPNRVTSFAMFTIPLAYLLLATGLTAVWSAGIPARRAVAAVSARRAVAAVSARRAVAAVSARRAVAAVSARRAVAAVLLASLLALSLYALTNYYQREQLLNPAFAPPWRQVASIIQSHEKPGDFVVSIENAFVRYYDGQSRLGHEPEIHKLIAGTLPFDHRIWLITRDRGSQEMAGYGLQLRDKLLAQGANEQAWNIDPRTPREQQMLSKILRRPAWDAYVKLYLFTP